jgi:5,10-methylenetetrahydromethanopterin reductase
MKKLSLGFQTNKTVDEYIALAQLIDQYDFDAVSAYCDAPYQPSYAPLLLMAPHLKRARLGASTVSPARIHPIDIASQTQLLAQMAAGGVYVGVSRGAWLAAHGIPEPERPIQALREAVGVIRYMLTGGTGGYDGTFFSLAGSVNAPFPALEPTPPILIGTWGPKLAAVAGEIADEVKIGGSANPDFVPVMAGYIAEGERKVGRAVGTVEVVVGSVTVADEDRAAARTAARRSVALYLPVVAPLDPTLQIEPELVERLRVAAEQHAWDDAARLISDDLLDRFALAGDANDLIPQVEAIFEAGASRVEFGTPHGLVPERGVKILGEKVLPALKQRAN